MILFLVGLIKILGLVAVALCLVSVISLFLFILYCGVIVWRG